MRLLHGPLALLALLLGFGCASHPVVTRAPLPPSEREPSWIPGAAGVRLYTRVVQPEATPRAVVWFVLGPEISSAPLYPRFTAALEEAGFAWAVVHPRGSGFSDGCRGDVEDYGQVLGDYRQFAAELHRRFPATPLFLVGHSAGGPLALEVAAHSPASLAGVVLVNPAYRMKYAEGMGPSFCDYVVYASNYLFRPAALTVDMNGNPSAVTFAPDRFEAEAMQKDPLVVRYFSLRYLFAQKEVMDRSAENAAAIGAPLLVLEGSHDTLVDPTGNDELISACVSADKSKQIAPSGGHGSSAVETMTGPLLDWLLARSPSSRNGPGESPAGRPPGDPEIAPGNL